MKYTFTRVNRFCCVSLIFIAFATVLGALSAEAERILWDFNDGTMQGWKNVRVSTTTPLSFAPVASETIPNRPTFSASQLGLGAYFLGQTPDANDEAQPFHTPLWAQSPVFRLDPSGGDLTFKMNGCRGGFGELQGANYSFTTIPVLPVTWSGTTGVALQNEEGVFVLTKLPLAFSYDYNQGFTTYSFTAAELAHLAPGRAYTLNVIDLLGGHPSIIAIDDVSVPGILVGLMGRPSLQISVSTNTTKLAMRWGPTLAGKTQTLICSDDLSQPTANWSVVRSVTTTERNTCIEIDAPTRSTFFSLRSEPVYADYVKVTETPVSSTEFSGNSTTLSVTATGSLLTYQWYKAGNMLSGRTNSSLDLNNLTADDAGTYSVVVSGIVGSPVTNSATISVIPLTGRNGAAAMLPYVPEPKQVFTPDQFGTNKYFSPTFGFSLDWNPNKLSPAQRKAIGINLFNSWALSGAEKLTVPFGEGIAYVTESGLHGSLEGAGYFESTLAAYEAHIWNSTPSYGLGGADGGVKLVVFNIETSLWWGKDTYTGNSHWPSWDSVKTHSIKCESDGVTRTLEQIDQLGLWDIETKVRRANRTKVLFQVTRAKSAPGIRISYGPSLYQGMPRIDFSTGTGIFLEGEADVSHIGGNNGNITLNGRNYTGITGSPWADEQVMCGYYYLWNFDLLSYQDYLDIWVNKLPATQNYPYVWSKIRPIHVVADEKGYLQLNRRLMNLRLGGHHGILRMAELVYEGDFAGFVPGAGLVIARMPFAELQPAVTGNSEAPKIWQPPYLQYSRYCVTRFFAGSDPDWGFHLFPVDPTMISTPLTNSPYYNHHVHSVTALLQARNDMQPYESYYTGSTLVEDPEVQPNQTGAFTVYTGTEAYNNDGGKQGPQRPAYMLRYKAISGGWQVVILGGMNQNWTEERTDMVRVPGGLLNGNQFRVKLRGPAAHVYSFIVKSSDTNQVYEALSAADTSWEKPGYAGRTRAN